METGRGGKIEDLLEEGRAIQERLSTQNMIRWQKRFVRLMLNGRSSLVDIARVNIVAGGVWGGRFEGMYFDVCVFIALAQSNVAKPRATCYEYHEQRKIAKYAERVRGVEQSSFVLLVFSISGGAGVTNHFEDSEETRLLTL